MALYILFRAHFVRRLPIGTAVGGRWRFTWPLAVAGCGTWLAPAPAPPPMHAYAQTHCGGECRADVTLPRAGAGTAVSERAPRLTPALCHSFIHMCRVPCASSSRAHSRKSLTLNARVSRAPLGEEVVALVVDDDERREVLDLDLPHGLHPELRVLQHLHALDRVFREDRRGAAD